MYIIYYRDYYDYHSEQQIIGFARDIETAELAVSTLQEKADIVSKQYDAIWEKWYKSSEYKDNGMEIVHGPIWEECHKLEYTLLSNTDELVKRGYTYGFYEIEELKL